MNLGRLDVCLRVRDVKESKAFYERLGFERSEGDDSEGWAVMVAGAARIGLYEAVHVTDAVSLNFRGGHVGKIAAMARSLGLTLESEAKFADNGSGSAMLRDPDGYLLFFDSTPEEIREMRPGIGEQTS